MPNIYYSSPNVPFASATQGFLANLKDFTKLDLAQQGVDQRGEALRMEGAAEGRRNRALDIQEENAQTRRARLELDLIAQEQQFQARQALGGAMKTLGEESIGMGLLDDDELNSYMLRHQAGENVYDDLERTVNERGEKVSENEAFNQKWEDLWAEAQELLVPTPEDSPLIRAGKERKLEEIRSAYSTPFNRIKANPDALLNEMRALSGDGMQVDKVEILKAMSPGWILGEKILEMLNSPEAPDAVKEQTEVLDLEALRGDIEQ